MASKKEISMNELTKEYEKFIANKKVKKGNKTLFDKAIKKAVTIKQRGSK